MRKLLVKSFMVLFLLGNSACASIKMPNMDFIKFPDFRKEFKKDAENIGDFPKVENAPQKPDDIRSDAEWDRAAKDIMNIGDDFTISDAGGMSSAEIEKEMQRLGKKVEEYKLDDPK